MRCGTVLLIGALALMLADMGQSARILAIFPFPGKSHFNSFSNLLDELAKRGHQLTVVSAFPKTPPPPNYKDIVIDDYLRQSGDVNFFEKMDINVVGMMIWVSQMTIQNCERFLNYPQIQELIDSKEKFDLIIFEIFLSECAYGFMHKFKAPFIQISPNTVAPWSGDGVGNPNFFSFVPDSFLGYTDHMTFTERLLNSLFETYMILLRKWYILPSMDAIMRKHFKDPTLPTIPEIEDKASFLLLNSHVTLHHPRPFTPNTAEVGGMHIKEPKKLPQDLQKYLDEAPHGVIYFSLGSHIRSSQMPEAMRNAFLETFAELKQNVLWKWETDSLPGQPKNVRTQKWLPQNDILAHPNVKVFITHGGLLSTLEATHHGKALVAVPIMGDQIVNAQRAQTAGYAIALDLRNITKKSLSWALNEVLSNPSYAENAKRRSSIFTDHPQKPLERAVYWVEYVLRHKGAPHMRSAALDLNFCQYYLLDVIAAVLLCSITVFAITAISCRALCRRMCSRSTQAKKDKKVSQAKKNK